MGVEGEHSKPLAPAKKETEPRFNLIVCLQGDETEYNCKYQGSMFKKMRERYPIKGQRPEARTLWVHTSTYNLLVHSSV